MNYLIVLVCLVGLVLAYLIIFALCKSAGTADERQGLR